MFKQLSVRNTLVKLVGALFLFVFVKDEKDLLIYILCVTLPGLVGNILLWRRAIEYIDKVSFKDLNVIRHLRSVLVFFIPAVSVQIYHTVDKVMLQWVSQNNYENGYYDQANKIVTVLLTILTAYNSVMHSRMSNLYKYNNQKQIDSYMSKSVSFIEFIGFPMSVGLFAIAPRFVPVLFGESFSDVILLLRIFSPMIIITGLSNMVANLCLVPSGNQGKSNIAIVCGAVINVIFNCLLIPKYSAAGACCATIASELTILLIMCLYQKGINLQIFKGMTNYLVGSLFMGIIVCFLDSAISYQQSIWANIFIMFGLVLVGMVVYLGFLIIRKDPIMAEFVNFFKKIFSRK